MLPERQRNQLEPHTRCKPSGVARQFITPYGVEIVEVRDVKRVFVFDIGGPHTYRTIYMDGRSHPDPLTPRYYGHSIGRWDGDTLIVDTVGFNEGFWLDRRGTPHTDKLRTDRALHAHRFAHHQIRAVDRRSGRLHGSVDDDVELRLGGGHGAVRVRVPAGKLRRQPDAGRAHVDGSDKRDHAIVRNQERSQAGIRRRTSPSSILSRASASHHREDHRVLKLAAHEQAAAKHPFAQGARALRHTLAGHVSRRGHDLDANEVGVFECPLRGQLRSRGAPRLGRPRSFAPSTRDWRGGSADRSD